MNIYRGSLSCGIAKQIWKDIKRAGLSQHPETGRDYCLCSSSPFVFLQTTNYCLWGGSGGGHVQWEVSW